MESYSFWGEFDVEREGRGGLELDEEGGVFLEEFKGSGRKVDVGFEKREIREREGFGWRRDDLVFEGENLF